MWRWVNCFLNFDCSVPKQLRYELLLLVLINTETLLEARRDVGLEINAGKTKYFIMSRHSKLGQNRNVRRANESFENVAKCKYLGTTLTSQNDICNEIKIRLHSGNTCYHSVSYQKI
jgi:hypothetical protein